MPTQALLVWRRPCTDCVQRSDAAVPERLDARASASAVWQQADRKRELQIPLAGTAAVSSSFDPKGLRTSVGLVGETVRRVKYIHFCVLGLVWGRSDKPLACI